MLKPLVKRGLFLALKKGFYPIKWGRWTLGGISPLGINLPPKHVFGCRERPANPYRVSWRSVQGTKKRKKHAWVEHFTPTPKRPPLRTL